MFKKAEYKKLIFQGLKCKILFDIETKDQVFCIALGPVNICIYIGTIELMYLFYNIGSTAVGQEAACTPVMQQARVRSSVGTGFLGEVFSGFFLTCKTNVGKL